MKTITQQEYLVAQGLYHLATFHARKTEEYAKALEQHLGEEHDSFGGHVADSVWGVHESPTVDRLLEKLELEVARPEA